jgi:hypothetical protein
MPLIDTSNPSANWHDVLYYWSRIANWTVHKPNEQELNRDIRAFAVALLSEKDWLINEYPTKKAEINDFVSATESLSIVFDLANMTKHRTLNWKRSNVKQTDYRGKVSISDGTTRKLEYLQLEDGRVIEIMNVLRQALDSLESFRLKLRFMNSVKENN